ncbi:sigma factor-like helix-turn-helix DNA-binding protein [Streptomyces sp. NPDC002499]
MEPGRTQLRTLGVVRSRGSIDTPGGDTETGESAPTYTDAMGVEDPALELTQAQIGSALNVSQMQISRLLNRILAKLRTGLLDA